MLNMKTQRLKIAIQKKGRLTAQTMQILKDIGLQFELSERSLFASCENFPLEIILVRDDDIPEMVKDGVADLGIVGENMIQESAVAVVEIISLGFGKCRFIIACPKDSKIKKLSDLKNKKIATSYPVVTESFFEIEKIPVTIVPIKGSVEIAPVLEMSDAIADFSSTGTTLLLHDLREITEVFKSEAKLIANPNSLKNKFKLEQIERLKMRIEGLIRARQTKYIMMNAPESAVFQIAKIIPGCASPTVVPLQQKGMVAVHSVVSEEVFWDVIEQLKKVGATGILVSPIEKMII